MNLEQSLRAERFEEMTEYCTEVLAEVQKLYFIFSSVKAGDSYKPFVFLHLTPLILKNL